MVEILSKNDISKDQVYALIAWPIKLVYLRGVSFFDHEAKNIERCREDACRQIVPPSSKPYVTLIGTPATDIAMKS